MPAFNIQTVPNTYEVHFWKNVLQVPILKMVSSSVGAILYGVLEKDITVYCCLLDNFPKCLTLVSGTKITRGGVLLCLFETCPFKGDTLLGKDILCVTSQLSTLFYVFLFSLCRHKCSTIFEF